MGVDILGPTFTTLLTLLLITWCGYQWKIGKWEAGPWWTDAARAHSSLATDTNSGILKMQPWPDAWHFLAPFHPGPKMIPPHLYWYQHTNMFLVQILMLQYFRLLWFWHWYCDEYTYYTLYHNIQSLLLGWKPLLGTLLFGTPCIYRCGINANIEDHPPALQYFPAKFDAVIML